jgi:hypothetical protein
LGSEGSMQAISNFFKPAERGAGTVNYTIERELSGQQERLILSQDSGTTLPSAERLAWSTSTLMEASPARWSELFGGGGRLATASTDALIVRFQSTPTQSRWLGIRVQVAAAERPGIVARLRGVVENWRRSQPTAPSRFGECLISLRAAIRKYLNPIDLEFYYNNNRGKVRAAQILVFKPCTYEGCGA